MTPPNLETIEAELASYNVNLLTEAAGEWKDAEAQSLYEMIVEKVAARLYWRSRQPDLASHIHDTPSSIFKRMFNKVDLIRSSLSKFTGTYDDGTPYTYYAWFETSHAGTRIHFSDAAFDPNRTTIKTNPKKPEHKNFLLKSKPDFLALHEFGHILHVPIKTASGTISRNDYFRQQNGQMVGLLEQKLSRKFNLAEYDDNLIVYSVGHQFASRSTSGLAELGADAAANWYNDSYTDDDYGSTRRKQMDEVIGEQLKVAYGIEQPKPIEVIHPDHPLLGLHGDGAGDWLLDNNVNGWAVETFYSPDDFKIVEAKKLDFTKHEAAGIHVIIRWNYSYASYDGGGGTYPQRSRHDQFINWCVQCIKKSKGVWGHILGNEPNNPAESPRSNGQVEYVAPSDVIRIFKGVRQLLGDPKIRLSPPALDPTNAELIVHGGEEPRTYFLSILGGLRTTQVDFFALHAYSYGSIQEVSMTYPDMFDSPPLLYQFYSIRMWEPFARELRHRGFERVPIVITETNHQYLKDNPGDKGWDDNQDGAAWIEKVYQYIREWNDGPGDQFVHGVCLYRYQGGGDPFEMKGKDNLLKVLKRIAT